jgi:SET domain-containing protein
MMRKHILDSIKQECFVRLKPSKVCDGVGVFALRLIPAGTILFADVVPDTDFVRWDQLDDINPIITSYLSSICNTTPDGLYLSQTVNNINLSFYVNHSAKPNVFHDRKLDRFVTLEDIQEGEEILCKYESDEIDW